MLRFPDFDQHEFQVILQGDDSVEKWIENQKVKMYISPSIRVGQTSPYMFCNVNLDKGSIYLAQNTDSRESAIAISQTWFTHNYNPGWDPKDTDTDPANRPRFTLYSYGSGEEIKVYDIKGKETPHAIRIVGYKIQVDGELEVYYTALLEL